MPYYLKLIFFLSFWFLAFTADARRVNVFTIEQFLNYSNCSNVSLIIRDSINLQNRVINLTKKNRLIFKGKGLIANGCLSGNDTEIFAENRTILLDVKIIGTWRNQIVFGDWLSYSDQIHDDNNFFLNLMSLCQGNRKTHLYLAEKTYRVSAVNHSAPIIIPSYTYWHNKATIIMKPSSYSKYNMVLLSKVTDVTIDGGVFIGDVENHIDNKGEWGHGIKCGGANNIILKNLTCERFWGDGIDLIEGIDRDGHPSISCNSIVIDNVICRYNRRQGISIEAAQNVKILNSEFTETGAIKYTLPSSGIDIEPWTGENGKIKNILIQNCVFKNNKGLDFNCQANLQLIDNYLSFVNNIKIVGCNIGTIRINKTFGISLKRCAVKSYFGLYSSDRIDVKKSSIPKPYKHLVGNNIIIDNCNIY